MFLKNVKYTLSPSSFTIYVAESNSKGGTWSGATDGLKNRQVFVRFPQESEQNANLLLIKKGAQAVNVNGTLVEVDSIISECLGSEKKHTKTCTLVFI